MRTLCVLLLLASSVAVADPHAGGADLVHGAGISFMLRAPTGWPLDADNAHDQGLDALYHAANSTDAFAFARALPKEKHTTQQLIDQTISGMRDQAPRLAVDPASTWTCGKTHWHLVTLAHDPADHAEALLFLDEHGAVVVLGLIADDASHRTAALPRLRELCTSYHYVGPATP